LSTHRNDPPSSLEYLRLSMSGHLMLRLICECHSCRPLVFDSMTKSTILTISSNGRLSITETIIGGGRLKRWISKSAVTLLVLMANYQSERASSG